MISDVPFKRSLGSKDYQWQSGTESGAELGTASETDSELEAEAGVMVMARLLI